MKSFSYDIKTGRYEFRFVDNINNNDITVLKLVRDKGFATHTNIEGLFRNLSADDIFQLGHDITYHLSHLGLIEWKSKFRMCLKYNVKDYKKSKFVEMDGYFLTEN